MPILTAHMSPSLRRTREIPDMSRESVSQLLDSEKLIDQSQGYVLTILLRCDIRAFTHLSDITESNPCCGRAVVG